MPSGVSSAVKVALIVPADVRTDDVTHVSIVSLLLRSEALPIEMIFELAPKLLVKVLPVK